MLTISPHCVSFKGPGESGKSTIFKQMKIIEGREGRQGINEEERRSFTSIVRVNVLSQFKLLLQICKDENLQFPKQVRHRYVSPAKWLFSIVIKSAVET